MDTRPLIAKAYKALYGQGKIIHESFERTRFSNTPRKEMKKVWRIKKKISSTEDKSKDPLEDQYYVNSKIEGNEKNEAPNQG